MSSSLRGCLGINVTVSGAKEGYHSGEVGGIIPETFRVLRTLLNRIDDPKTGIIVPDFATEIPYAAIKEAENMVANAGD